MAFGAAAAERAALEATYEDTATVRRVQPRKGPDHITRPVLATVHEGVCCALSMGSDPSRQTSTAHHLERDALLLTVPELDLQPGDEVTVRRFGRDSPQSPLLRRYALVGRPAVYATHQEAGLKEGDLA